MLPYSHSVRSIFDLKKATKVIRWLVQLNWVTASLLTWYLYSPGNTPDLYCWTHGHIPFINYMYQLIWHNCQGWGFSLDTLPYQTYHIIISSYQIVIGKYKGIGHMTVWHLWNSCHCIYVLYILNKKYLYFYYNIFIQVLMKKHPENQSIVAE